MFRSSALLFAVNMSAAGILTPPGCGQCCPGQCTRLQSSTITQARCCENSLPYKAGRAVHEAWMQWSWAMLCKQSLIPALSSSGPPAKTRVPAAVFGNGNSREACTYHVRYIKAWNLSENSNSCHNKCDARSSYRVASEVWPRAMFVRGATFNPYPRSVCASLRVHSSNPFWASF